MLRMSQNHVCYFSPHFQEPIPLFWYQIHISFGVSQQTFDITSMGKSVSEMQVLIKIFANTGDVNFGMLYSTLLYLSDFGLIE